MPDTTPKPAVEPKKTRAPRGFISQALEDAIELAGKCAHEAADADMAATLAAREWTAADLTALNTSLTKCGDLVLQIKDARTGKDSATDEEEDAHEELLHALDPILKGAKRTYPDGSAERAAYGIGQSLPNKSAADLLTYAKYASDQLSPGAGGTAPKDKLKGVTAAEIAAIATLVQNYKDADWAQADAQKSASELLALLKKEIAETLQPLTRDLQGAADQAFTHRNPANAAQRKAFGLQADRPLND